MNKETKEFIFVVFCAFLIAFGIVFGIYDEVRKHNIEEKCFTKREAQIRELIYDSFRYGVKCGNEIEEEKDCLDLWDLVKNNL